MNTQRRFGTGCLTRAAASLVLALAATLPLVPAAQAEALSRFQPGSLIQAERALAQGQPERALSLLHRQRAILRHSTFRPQAEALTCQAYRQMQDVQRAAQVCGEVVAHDGGRAVAAAYDRRLAD